MMMMQMTMMILMVMLLMVMLLMVMLLMVMNLMMMIMMMMSQGMTIGSINYNFRREHLPFPPSLLVGGLTITINNNQLYY